MSNTIQQAQQGNEEAFTQLYHENIDMVQGIVRLRVRPNDFDDVCQDIWLVSYRNLPKLKNPNYFKTWLCRVAISKCIDSLRRAVVRDCEESVGGMDFCVEPKETEVDTWLLDKVMGAVDRDGRTILEQFYLKGKTYKQLAKEYNLPIGAVRGRLHRARKLARELALEHQAQ